MTKMYLMPVGRLNLESLSKMFKQAKADARKSTTASTVKEEKQNESKTA